VALLDCCREKIDAIKWRGSVKSADENLDLDSEFRALTALQGETRSNLIITYGCPPSKGVPTKSTIAVAYFKFLYE